MRNKIFYLKVSFVLLFFLCRTSILHFFFAGQIVYPFKNFD